MKWAGTDASEAFVSIGHSPAAQMLLKNFCVGILEEDDKNESKGENSDFDGASPAGVSAIDRFVTRYVCHVSFAI